MKKGFILVFLCSFLLFKAEAAMVSFFIVETGLPLESQRNTHSILWENTFMDVFFDSGYIVSNYPIMRLETKPQEGTFELSMYDLYEAREGGIDYILVTQIDYSSVFLTPDEISFFIFEVTPYKIIYEKRINGRAYRSEREATDDMKMIIRELVQFISGI